ncbi:MAG: hypothetical protein GWN18_11555, partial [Thermoplasmata archaeon]|nr:hypothetical protein [Thermoplasmata archaeon]NIT77977.1 hypothetical protein [Thermoplasmata archaeon]NIU49675.1 hypothetical protein [Thermoplasmata archaeon]NIV79348.1 hypothetical protein [Thermoplasmata archaeon]NIW83176.1 hypothetical protein [Thermoplasmata archaeon]
MALCIIEGLSLSDSTVNVGDTLEVVVRSNRTRDSGTLLIGRDPKAACIECDLACAPDSDHIVSRRFSHGVPVEFQVTEEWLREGERRNPADPSLTVEVSCRGTD